jgi:hypothetical protein
MEFLMIRNPYLRAYMAGITLPTAFFLVVFGLNQFVFHVPAAMERALTFPLAFVPNAFGLWNMLFLKLHKHWRHPLGLHGAALPFLLGPVGTLFMISHGFVRIMDGAVVYFDVIRIPYWYLIILPLVAISAYYLIWKYAVGYLNAVVELPR